RTTRRCRFCGYWHGVPTPLGAVRPGHSSPGRCCRPGRCWGWRRLRSVRTRRVSVGSFGNSTHRTENGYRLRPHGPHLWTVSAGAGGLTLAVVGRSEEHTPELQSRFDLVCRPLSEKKSKI